MEALALCHGADSQPAPHVLGALCALSHPSRTLQDKQQGRKGGFQPLVGMSEVRDKVTETPSVQRPTTTPSSQVSPSAHTPLIPAARPGRDSHFCRVGQSVEMEGALVETQI